MKTILILCVVAVIASVVFIWAATEAVRTCAEEERQQTRMYIEDDRFSCGLIEED